MTPEQQRIALAEWAGWKRPDHPDVMKVKEGWTKPEAWWMCPQGVLRFKHDIPDYLNDLNAVHELEEKLTFEQAEQFEDELCHIVVKCNEQQKKQAPWRFAVAHATAAQRCEALLKTLNLWKP